MSDRIDSILDAFFGDDGPFGAIFGKGGKFEKAFEDLKGDQKVVRHHVSSKKARERAYYQESLVTELLILFAGKGFITNAEARDVIARAKERAQKKTNESGSEIQGGAMDDVIQDERPHRQLECARCKKATSHLIEGPVARCRVCVTTRSAS